MRREVNLMELADLRTGLEMIKIHMYISICPGSGHPIEGSVEIPAQWETGR
jgi:hypothetical protein